ncbi:MAG TPA: hypothetical protein VHC44_08385 [Verrucomicrobiae bacterium]|nr:hypothetical protein [Verrucomicrobiae bacterium]
MPFDGLYVWGIIGTVSFRPLSSVFCRAAVTGLACVAFAWAAHAGEGMRSIEVVPFSGNKSLDTNFEQSAHDDLQTFKAWEPTAPHPYKSPGPAGAGRAPALLRPQQPQVLTKEQQQLLDRRRNWIFMSPEDYASPTGKEEKDPTKAGSDDDKDQTAMERFFQRMSDSEKSAATNRMAKMNGDRSTGPDSAVNNAPRNSDESPFAQSPFASTPDSGIFQSIPKSASGGGVFAPDNDVKMPTPEEVRMQAEQKEHMDTFKQLWNIDQAPATTPVAAPASGAIDSAPLFGVSAPAVSSTFNAASPLTAGNSSSTPQPAARPVAAPRISAPPHADFAAPQRPF